MSKTKPGSLSAGLIAVKGQATPATTTVEPPIPAPAAPAAPVVAVEPSPSPAVASVEPVADTQDETKEKRIAMTVKLEESLYWRLQDIVKAETRAKGIRSTSSQQIFVLALKEYLDRHYGQS